MPAGEAGRCPDPGGPYPPPQGRAGGAVRLAEPAARPARLAGRPIRLARWGNRDRTGRLPPGGWTWRESVEAGRWAGLRPEPAVVPAAYCLVGGMWYRVREGVQAVVVRDHAGPAAFVVVERASRNFGVMTRSDWAPALVNETI